MEHRIFHVPEMLEAILKELPMKDLLLSQSVCKTWKNAIESSPKLQRSLYFAADGEVHPTAESIKEEYQKTAVSKPQRNELLRPFFKTFPHANFTFDTNGKVVLPNSTDEAKASWKHMLLTQPAVSKLTVYISAKSRNTPAALKGTSRDVVQATGIRMKDVLEAVESLKSEDSRKDHSYKGFLFVDSTELTLVIDNPGLHVRHT